MNNSFYRVTCRFVGIAAVLVALSGKTSAEASKADIALPMIFEANPGQANPQVNYISRGRGYSLLVTPAEATLSLYKKGIAGLKPRPFFLRMKFAGGNQQPVVEGLDELPGKANYFLGNDPKQWLTNVALYRKVRHAAVYPGIDVVFY